MQITLLRDQIVGTGKIQYPQTIQKDGKLKDEVSRAGRVVKINEGKRGDVVDLSDAVCERLVSLGSALVGEHKNLPKLT